MKKCNGPATESEEAFICRYCDQNPNLNEMHPRALPLVWHPTLDDMKTLGDSFEASLQLKPGVMLELWDSTRRMALEVLLPSLKLCVERGAMTEGRLCRELESMRWFAAMCAMACYGVGVEETARSLVDLEAEAHVRRLCRAFGSQAVCDLLRLAHEGYIPEEEALTRARYTLDHILTWGTGMWGRGFVEGRAVVRKDAGFLEALKRLNRDGSEPK